MIRYLKFFLITMTSFALISGCSVKQDKNKEKKGKSRYAIILFDDTAVRIDPIIFSAKVTELKKGQAVQIINTSEKKAWVGGNTGYWYRIRTEQGFSGWVFESTLKRLKPGSKTKINEYIAEFWEEESKKVMNGIDGKWWSINITGDFTNHCLVITSDGKYESYTRAGEDNKIVGEYNFNFENNEINFLNDTSFKSNLKFAKRGSTYKLYRDNRFAFKRIIMNQDDHQKKGKNGNKTE